MNRMINILLIEDDVLDQMEVQRVLNKRSIPYNMSIAPNGEVALAILKEKNNSNGLPDIILLDLNMPKMSGMEAIPYFRSQFPSCPVIVLTGAGTVDRATTLFKQGVMEFLTKPIDKDKLLGAVKKAMTEGGWKDDFRT